MLCRWRWTWMDLQAADGQHRPWISKSRYSFLDVFISLYIVIWFIHISFTFQKLLYENCGVISCFITICHDDNATVKYRKKLYCQFFSFCAVDFAFYTLCIKCSCHFIEILLFFLIQFSVKTMKKEQHRSLS